MNAIDILKGAGRISYLALNCHFENFRLDFFAQQFKET